MSATVLPTLTQTAEPSAGRGRPGPVGCGSKRQAKASGPAAGTQRVWVRVSKPGLLDPSVLPICKHATHNRLREGDARAGVHTCGRICANTPITRVCSVGCPSGRALETGRGKGSLRAPLPAWGARAGAGAGLAARRPRHAEELPRRDGAPRRWKCSARGSWCFRQSRAGGSRQGLGRAGLRRGRPEEGEKPTSPAAARARPGQQPYGAAERAHLGLARFAAGSHQPGSALRRGAS